MRRAFVVTCCLLSTLPALHGAPAAVAEPAPAADEVASILAKDPLEVRDLLRLADLTSPEIAAARATASEARGVADQVRAFPNPQLELDVENVPTGGTIDDGERTLGVSLPVALVGRGGRVTAAKAEHTARLHDAESVRRDVHRHVRELGAASIRLRDALERRSALSANAQRVEEIARLRAEAKAEPRSNALKASIELAAVESETARLEAGLAGVSAQLGATLGGLEVPIARLRADAAATASAWTLDGLRADVAARHPRILAARSARDAAKASAGAAGVAWVPEPELRFGWGRFPSEEEFVEAGASIPIPLFDRRRSEAASARAGAERAERELDDVEARLDADAAAAFARWNAARTRATDYREHVLKAAEESMTLAMEGYQAGRLSFLDLLDALRTVADAQRSDLEIAGERDDAEAALLALSPPALETSEGESR